MLIFSFADLLGSIDKEDGLYLQNYLKSQQIDFCQRNSRDLVRLETLQI